MEVNCKLFGERLRTAYKKRGMTQETLSDAVDVTRQTISKYVTGEHYPPVNKLIKLSTTLDVSTDYLLGLSDIMNISDNQNDIDNSFTSDNSENAEIHSVFDWYLKESKYTDSDFENFEEILGLSTLSIRKVESWQHMRLDRKQIYSGHFDNIDALNMIVTGKYSDLLLRRIGTLLSETEKALIYIEPDEDELKRKKKNDNSNIIGNEAPLGYTEFGVSEKKEMIHFYIWKATEAFQRLLKDNVAHYAKGKEYDIYSNSHITI